MIRVRHQDGSVVKDKRRKEWRFRYKDRTTGGRKNIRLGNFKELPTKADAQRAAAPHKLTINAAVTVNDGLPLFGDVVAKYLDKEAPSRHHTLAGYHSWLTNHILPQYGDMPIAAIKHFDVKDWLKARDLADKSKGHIRSLMHRIFEFAMERELMAEGKNPMERVRLAGTTLREREPIILSQDDFWRLAAEIDKMPPRDMVVIARPMVVVDQSLGLGCSELCGIKWSDFNFGKRQLHIQRALVANREGDVKAKARSRYCPLDDHLIDIIMEWRKQSEFNADSDWVWASKYARDPQTKACVPGCLPYFGWGIQRNVILPAGLAAGLGRIGWHTFRHTYRTWLDEIGSPVGVIQSLMGHSDIRTTMNVYGKAQAKPQLEANSKIVRMVLKKAAGA